MIMNIKLSVIVPIYNTPENFLQNCLESLHCQNFMNVEFLIINDGSTESWIESAVHCYCCKDSRFKYITKQNTGVADTRNLGLKLSQGEYIMFVDSDDELLPNACDNAIKIIESVGSDVVLMGMLYGHPMEGHLEKMLNEEEKTDMMYSVMAMTSIYEDWHVKIDSPWAKIFKSSIIKEYGIMFPVQLRRSEDALFCLHYYNSCRKIYINSLPIYDYIGNPGSICRRCSTISIEALPLVLEEEEKFLEDNPHLKNIFYNALLERNFEGIQESLCTYFFNRQNPKPIKILAKELKAFIEDPLLYHYFHSYRLNNLKGKRLRKKIYWFFLKQKWYKSVFYFERIMHPAWIFKS